jgi:hypothetical protein
MRDKKTRVNAYANLDLFLLNSGIGKPRGGASGGVKYVLPRICAVFEKRYLVAVFVFCFFVQEKVDNGLTAKNMLGKNPANLFGGDRLILKGHPPTLEYAHDGLGAAPPRTPRFFDDNIFPPRSLDQLFKFIARNLRTGGIFAGGVADLDLDTTLIREFCEPLFGFVLNRRIPFKNLAHSFHLFVQFHFLIFALSTIPGWMSTGAKPGGRPGAGRKSGNFFHKNVRA